MSATPPLLHLANIALTFGSQPLLNGAHLSVKPGARLCLVGRNGSGKSTLLKIAAGLIEPDDGEVFVQPGIVVRYLAQSPSFSDKASIGEVVLSDIFDNEDRQKGHQIMADLHLDPEKSVIGLSGGEMRRVALAQAMACQPDILLLDEPTNHLDLPAIEWLENSLRALPAALVLVSHDRRFLANMAEKTIWLDRGETHDTAVSFDRFEDWRDVFLEREATAQIKLDRKIAREDDWLRHGVSGRRRRNVRRVKELFELRQQKQNYQGPMGAVALNGPDADSSSKLVAKFDRVSKAIAGRSLVKDLSFILARGNRLGIVGPNGAGKTTLIKLLLADLEPDGGTIRLGKKLDTLVLDQSRSGIKPDWTIKDALTDGAGDLVAIGEETMHVIGYMQAFLFHPSQMRTPATILSGGEQARLLLARGLRRPSNFLIMDEPTNDLDLETLDLLQEMIASYEGTVVLVSHDRDFLDRTVTHVLAAEGDGKWVLYAGGYSDMTRQRSDHLNRSVPQKFSKPASAEETPVRAKRPPRLSYKQNYRLEQLPSEMEDLRAKISACESQMADPNLYNTDPQAFTTLADKLSMLRDNLVNAEEEWLTLELLREELS
jgi:ATP-binding cassette subfamily F protein uup